MCLNFHVNFNHYYMSQSHPIGNRKTSTIIRKKYKLVFTILTPGEERLLR